MKPYHEELSCKAWLMWQHHISQKFFFWKLLVIIRPLPCWQQDSVLLAGPGIYPQIYYIFYDNRVLLGLISQCGTPSWTLQKRPSSSLQFGQEKNMPVHSNERRAHWFVLKIVMVFPIPTVRVGIWWWILLQ